MNVNTKEKDYNYFLRLDNIYKKMKTCNNDLVIKSNTYKNNDCDLIESSFLFYISSFGLSYIKNIYLNMEDTLGNIVNVRCVFEGLAILSYLSDRKNNQELNHLLRLQSFVLERKTYSKYPTLNKILFDLDSMEMNYKSAKGVFKSKLELNGKNYKYLENSSIPFINKSDSFERIIGCIFGDETKTAYKIQSLLSHPHDFRDKIHSDGYLQMINDATVSLLERKFKDYKPHQNGLEAEFNNTLRFSPVYSLVINQNKMLVNVSKILYKEGFVSYSAILYELSIMSMDYYFDIAMGFTEHGTTKWKYFAELLGLLYVATTDFYYAKEALLLFYHTKTQLELILSKDINEQNWKIAFSEYLLKYDNNIRISKFKTSFMRPVGFLIDNNGNTPSLRKLAFNMLDNICVKINEANLVFEDKTIQLSTYLKMKYDESQNMSHANGYMFFSPTGAWIDGQNVALYSEKILNSILEMFVKNEKHSEMTQFKTARNIVRNYIKKVQPMIDFKFRFFSSPKINKDF